MTITLHVRRRHSSRCAHFILESARRTSSSHCSCSISCSLLSRDAFLSFSLRVSLSDYLSVDFLSAALSASSLCVSLGSSFLLSVRRSQKVHRFLQYIGAVGRIELRPRFGLPSPQPSLSPFYASSACFASEHCNLQQSPAK